MRGDDAAASIIVGKQQETTTNERCIETCFLRSNATLEFVPDYSSPIPSS